MSWQKNIANICQVQLLSFGLVNIIKMGNKKKWSQIEIVSAMVMVRLERFKKNFHADTLQPPLQTLT